MQIQFVIVLETRLFMKRKREIATFLSVLLILSLIFNNNAFASEIVATDQLGTYDTSKNFGVANDFNIFTFGNMLKDGADAEGRVAVGGNAQITNYSIGSRLSKSNVRADLIVGGDISIDSTAFNNGNIVISPTSKIIEYNNVWKNNGVPQSEPYRADLIDFQAAKTYLTNASAYWGELSNNGTVSANSGQLTLKGNDSTLNVFNFDGTNIANSGNSLSNINGITIDVPADSSVVINVLGDTVTFGSYAMQDASGKSIDGSDSSVKASHILWNFPSTASISCNTIIGSVLAPAADVKINGAGHVAGNLIANSLSAANTGSFETHIQVNGGNPCLFSGTLPSVPTAPVVKGNITVKYVDENNNPIAADTVMSDLDIKDYTLNSETIDGYKLNDTATKTVTLTDTNNTATVIFKYTKEVPAPAPVVKGNITVKYVDENNNPIATDTVMSDLDIKDYTLNSETIDGYKLNDTATKTVALTDTNNTATVIFKYTKEVPAPAPVVKGSITVKYVDENNNPIVADTVMSDLDIKDYTLNSETIDGYKLNDTATKTVTLTDANNTATVIFKYTKEEPIPALKGSITVKYVDENNNSIASDIVMSDLDIKDYTLSSKTIDGYDLNDTATKTVILTDTNSTATVIFKYTKEVPAPAPVVKGNITVKYVDENNNPIAADTVMSDLDIKDYTLSSKTIAGYDLNDTATKTVTLTDANNTATVIFKYTKEEPIPALKGSITVKYVDENNNSIASDTVMGDLDIKDYTLSSKTIAGYDLNDTTTKTVILTDTNSTATVIFKYTKEVPAPAPTPAPANNAKVATGTLVDGKTGQSLKPIESAVTRDANGKETVNVKAADAIAVKQPDGNVSPIVDLSKVTFSPDKNTEANITIDDGKVQVSGLSDGEKATYDIYYDLGNGNKIKIGTINVQVSNDGNVSITSSLIDPYGVVTDSATGEPISGAKIDIYYANTDNNKANGKIADTEVNLPIIDTFKPNSNRNPQYSDSNGNYGFMVFPNTDYYIIVTKDGYEQYKSPVISVKQDLVVWNISMKKIAITSASTGTNLIAKTSTSNTSILPKTGSAIDMIFLEAVGAIMIVIGIRLTLVRKKYR